MLVINMFLLVLLVSLTVFFFCPQGPAGPPGAKGATGGVGAPVSVISSSVGS